ncbi:hypothetical protein [Streptomyces qinglanensis]|uniref:hypothetical protein n=1 Tax=Streptomyces qinglanensis TaxID=943816 RepID=UPI003D73FE60
MLKSVRHLSPWCFTFAGEEPTPVHVEDGMLPVRTSPGLAQAPPLPEKPAVLEVTGS